VGLAVDMRLPLFKTPVLQAQPIQAAGVAVVLHLLEHQ
jgi:hypothetical protein